MVWLPHKGRQEESNIQGRAFQRCVSSIPSWLSQPRVMRFGNEANLPARDLLVIPQCYHVVQVVSMCRDVYSTVCWHSSNFRLKTSLIPRPTVGLGMRLTGDMHILAESTLRTQHMHSLFYVHVPDPAVTLQHKKKYALTGWEEHETGCDVTVSFPSCRSCTSTQQYPMPTMHSTYVRSRLNCIIPLAWWTFSAAQGALCIDIPTLIASSDTHKLLYDWIKQFLHQNKCLFHVQIHKQVNTIILYDLI